MNARGAVWGRIKGLDIYSEEEEEDMAQADVDRLIKSAQATSFANAITNAVWLNYPAAETVSHVSLWSAAVAGNPWGKKALTAPVTLCTGNLVLVRDIPAGA